MALIVLNEISLQANDRSEADKGVSMKPSLTYL